MCRLPALRLQVAAVFAVFCAVPAHGASGPEATTQDARGGAAVRWGIAIHGGVGGAARSSADEAVLTAALQAGHRVLDRGGRSIDAVEAAIRVMEDSQRFNAGRGAVRSSAGTLQLSASIMDGASLNAGAVAGLKQVKNPISLARLVMERSRHVMMIGEGAEAFAVQQGVKPVPESYFQTRDVASPARDMVAQTYDTVGAVALDRAGNLAAGTSTGGVGGTLPGRVGDSPIVGAGMYASNQSCAVSATGIGEYFIRLTVASDICARVRYRGMSIQDAARGVIHGDLRRLGGSGGVIVMDPAGNVTASFNTFEMYRGYVGADGKVVLWGMDR